MGLGAEVRLRGDGVHIPELYSQFQGELGNPQTLGVSVIGCLVVLTGPWLHEGWNGGSQAACFVLKHQALNISLAHFHRVTQP